jgi:nucleoside phosphorylase
MNAVTEARSCGSRSGPAAITAVALARKSEQHDEVQRFVQSYRSGKKIETKSCRTGIMAIMCIGCAMTAAAGATGARTWLQAHHRAWLTRRRLRAITVAMSVAALGVSSVGISGSSAQSSASQRPHAAMQK